MSDNSFFWLWTPFNANQNIGYDSMLRRMNFVIFLIYVGRYIPAVLFKVHFLCLSNMNIPELMLIICDDLILTFCLMVSYLQSLLCVWELSVECRDWSVLVRISRKLDHTTVKLKNVLCAQNLSFVLSLSSTEREQQSDFKTF